MHILCTLFHVLELPQMGNCAYLMHFLFFVDRGEFARWTLLAEATLFFGVKTGEFWRAMKVLNF